MRSVALDLAKKEIALCEVRDGKVVRRGVFSRQELERVLGPHTPPARVAIEACREAWYWSDVLRGWGHEPVLVDTTRVRQLGIGAHGRKNDRIDAEVLARALDKDSIPRAHELSHERQQLRTKLMVRASLVESRAQAMGEVRGLARAQGVLIGTCANNMFIRALDRTELPASVAADIAPLRALIALLDVEIEKIDRVLVAMCEKDPIVTLLMTAPGVGLIVAASFVSVIDDSSCGKRSRFDSAHKVESYLGLVPTEDTTGGQRRLGHITKRGNRYVRALLVEAAWTILRAKDVGDPLIAWGKRLSQRRSKPKVAAVAVARKLAGILWAMWRRRRPYDPRWMAKLAAAARQEQPLPIDLEADQRAFARANKKLSKHRRMTHEKKEMLQTTMD